MIETKELALVVFFVVFFLSLVFNFNTRKFDVGNTLAGAKYISKNECNTTKKNQSTLNEWVCGKFSIES